MYSDFLYEALFKVRSFKVNTIWPAYIVILLCGARDALNALELRVKGSGFWLRVQAWCSGFRV